MWSRSRIEAGLDRAGVWSVGAFVLKDARDRPMKSVHTLTMTHSTLAVLRLGGACLAAFLVWSSAAAQTTVAFTGGDVGDGLALTPSQVVYAYNVNGGSVTWQGVQFSGLSLGWNVDPFNAISDDPFASQSSADDNALRSLLQTVGFSPGAVDLTFSGLTAGASYQMTVLYYSGNFAPREEAFLANGSLVTLASVSQTTASYTSFQATADGNGEISFRAAASAAYGGTGHQDGVILNAIVVSSANAVPEPATYAGIAGVCALAAVWRRRRSQAL